MSEQQYNSQAIINVNNNNASIIQIERVVNQLNISKNNVSKKIDDAYKKMRGSTNQRSRSIIFKSTVNLHEEEKKIDDKLNDLNNQKKKLKAIKVIKKKSKPKVNLKN